MADRNRDRPRRIPGLPDDVMIKILQNLQTSMLFTASLVCRNWQRLIFESGPISQIILRPHLAVLRLRFGHEMVPRKIPTATVRKLLTLYARQELFGEFFSISVYDISELSNAATWEDSCPISLRRRQIALCGSLMVYAVGNKRVLVFDTQRNPFRLLTAIKVRSRPIALAVSEGYIAVLDEKKLHLYQLLARDTPKFLAFHIYSVTVPNLQNPSAVAITPDATSAPLVAVLGDELSLIHPSHALTEKRRLFFREGHMKKLSENAIGKSIACEAEQPRAHEWILTAPGASIGISFPMEFSMFGRHLAVSAVGPENFTHQRAAYLGSGYTNEDHHELAKRRLVGLTDGQELAGQSHDADSLFHHYRFRTGTHAGNMVSRWTPKHLDSGSTNLEDAIHLCDSYYLVTEADTGFVKIVTVAPFEDKLMLYRRGGTLEERSSKHCGYAVWSRVVGGKRGPGGYITFSPSEGRLKVLPLGQIPWESLGVRESQIGWELVRECSDIAIGPGDILAMVAASSRVIIVFETRIVVICLWSGRLSGVEDQAWSIGCDGRVRGPGEEASGMVKCFGFETGIRCSTM